MADIGTHPTLGTSLEGYWELDETSGTRVDETASARDLTDNNTVTSGTGVIGNSALFTAANSEYLNSSANWTHYAAAAVSINVWVKTSTDNGTAMVANINDGTTETMQIISISNTYRFDLRTSSTVSSPTIAESSIEDGAWHMLTGTYDGTTVEIYLDGVRQGTGTAQTGNINTSNPTKLAFGARSTGADLFWDGEMDLAGFWSKALTQSEITDLYNSGAGLEYEDGNYIMTAGTGAFTLTGIAASLNRIYTIVASVGSFVLTGIATAFKRIYTLALNVGSFVLTGISATFNLLLLIPMVAEVGSFILTGATTWLSRIGWRNSDKNSSTWTNENKS